MTVQFSTATRNASLDAIETTIGASPTLRIRTGPPPANCAAVRTGTILAETVLPADVWAAATGGSKALNAAVAEFNATGTGTAGHFEVVQGATCHLQGSITQTGGGGDMTMANTSLATGQPVRVNSLTLTAGGA
jgi:hypothetical protein